MENSRGAHTVSVGKHEGKSDHLKGLTVEEKITLTRIFKKSFGGVNKLDISGLGYGRWPAPVNAAMNIKGSIKSTEFLNQLRNYWLLRKNIAPRT
jgi:hypothetical protein